MINYTNLATCVARKTGLNRRAAMSFVADGYIRVDKTAPENQQAAYILTAATGAALNEFRRTPLLADPESIDRVEQEEQYDEQSDRAFCDQFGDEWTRRSVAWCISRRMWKRALSEKTLTWWLTTQECPAPVKTARRVYADLLNFATELRGTL